MPPQFAEVLIETPNQFINFVYARQHKKHATFWALRFESSVSFFHTALTQDYSFQIAILINRV
jgi:hypothetical protein